MSICARPIAALTPLLLLNAVVAHSHRVGQRRYEDMIFAYRSDLAARSARITPPRERIALQRRLLPQVLLNGDVSVEPIFASELYVDIAGSLVDIDRRRRGSNKKRKPSL